eukprot:14868259-Heterocapsa_arctica.AAC.1
MHREGVLESGPSRLRGFRDSSAARSSTARDELHADDRFGDGGATWMRRTALSSTSTSTSAGRETWICTRSSRT